MCLDLRVNCPFIKKTKMLTTFQESWSQSCHWIDAVYCFRIRSRWPPLIFCVNRAAKGDVSWWSLPVREPMDCVVRPPVSRDEAQRTPEHTDDPPHLTEADKTLTTQTARAMGAIAIKLGSHPHSQTTLTLALFIFFDLLCSIIYIFYW